MGKPLQRKTVTKNTEATARTNAAGVGKASGAGKTPRRAASIRAATAGAEAAQARQRIEPAWAEVASFVINFERRGGASAVEERITAHKMQDGGITEAWTGGSVRPMCEWIAAQVPGWADPVLQAPAVSSAASYLAPSVDTTIVSIKALRARQFDGAEVSLATGPTNRRRDVELKSGEMFDLDATIELSDAARAIGLDAGRACTVSFFSRNTGTLDRTVLGTAVTRRDGSEANSLRATLPRVVLPRGRYRLAMVAELSAPNGVSARRAYLQGPVIELS